MPRHHCSAASIKRRPNPRPRRLSRTNQPSMYPTGCSTSHPSACDRKPTWINPLSCPFSSAATKKVPGRVPHILVLINAPASPRCSSTLPSGHRATIIAARSSTSPGWPSRIRKFGIAELYKSRKGRVREDSWRSTPWQCRMLEFCKSEKIAFAAGPNRRNAIARKKPACTQSGSVNSWEHWSWSSWATA